MSSWDKAFESWPRCGDTYSTCWKYEPVTRRSLFLESRHTLCLYILDRMKTKVLSKQKISFGHDELDLGCVEQIGEESQTRAIVQALLHIKQRYANNYCWLTFSVLCSVLGSRMEIRGKMRAEKSRKMSCRVLSPCFVFFGGHFFWTNQHDKISCTTPQITPKHPHLY